MASPSRWDEGDAEDLTASHLPILPTSSRGGLITLSSKTAAPRSCWAARVETPTRDLTASQRSNLFRHKDALCTLSKTETARTLSNTLFEGSYLIWRSLFLLLWYITERADHHMVCQFLKLNSSCYSLS